MQQEDWFSQINIIRAFDVQTAFCISIMLCILMLCWCEILITHKTRNDIVSLWKWKVHQKEYIDGEIHNYRNCVQCNLALHTHVHFTALFQGLPGWAGTRKVQEAQLSPMDRAMRRVSWNLANCHAKVQKLLYDKRWSWRVKVSRCVINMCTQPWRIRVAFIVT